jgi:hypothetical protein
MLPWPENPPPWPPDACPPPPLCAATGIAANRSTNAASKGQPRIALLYAHCARINGKVVVNNSGNKRKTSQAEGNLTNG